MSTPKFAFSTPVSDSKVVVFTPGSDGITGAHCFLLTGTEEDDKRNIIMFRFTEEVARNFIAKLEREFASPLPVEEGEPVAVEFPAGWPA